MFHLSSDGEVLVNNYSLWVLNTIVRVLIAYSLSYAAISSSLSEPYLKDVKRGGRKGW